VVWKPTPPVPMMNSRGASERGFASTSWAAWGSPVPLAGQEWLQEYRTLALWAGYVDLLDQDSVRELCDLGDRQPVEAAAGLESARELRSALYTTLLDSERTPGFPVVRRYAEQAAGEVRLVPGAEGLAVWRLTPASGLVTPVLAVAWAAAKLLGEPQRHNVKACPGDYCGWLFLDQRGRRRWCSMAFCGNRAKVNAYLRRRAASTGPAEPD
jgi:SARP family transcriptional regulator, regulator of embCAB operon